MSTHTPGKWEAISNIVRTCRAADGSGGFLVAECPVNVGARLEDAILIASAPELLAQLQYATATLSAEGFDVSAMRAVIAKATGGQ